MTTPRADARPSALTHFVSAVEWVSGTWRPRMRFAFTIAICGALVLRRSHAADPTCPRCRAAMADAAARQAAPR